MVGNDQLLCTRYRSAADCRQEDNFLPSAQAYRCAVRAEEARIIVIWTIAPGYYLHQKRLRFQSVTSRVSLGTPAFPKGAAHHDEYFGTQVIYRNKAVISIPITVHGSTSPQLKLKVGWRGCADAGVCYPPTT
jgi:thiol:disulfide interchange protein DsbD